MRSFFTELWRGVAAGILVGLLIGFIVGLVMSAKFHLQLNLLALIGSFGATVGVLTVVIRRGALIAGPRRIALRAIGGGAIGLIVGPMLYWWGWCEEFSVCTIGCVLVLAMFAAVNETLDALAEETKPHAAS
ncbi:MAG: hypothetical protein JW959_05105 [Pirellulales bacterium]|nr:hypothetical protein [Pirellulales bacterium]